VEVQRATRAVRPRETVDPDDPAVADVIADWKKTPGTVRHPHHDDERGRARSDPTWGSTVSCAQPFSTISRSTCLCWGNVESGTALIDRHPRRDSSSTIWPSCSRARPCAAAALADCRRCWSWPSAEPVIKVSAPARCPRNPIPSRTSGTRSPACSTPGASTAACGAPTGPAHSRSSIRTAVEPFRLTDRLSESERGDADGRCLRQGLRLVAEERLGDPPLDRRPPERRRLCRNLASITASATCGYSE